MWSSGRIEFLQMNGVAELDHLKIICATRVPPYFDHYRTKLQLNISSLGF